MSLSINKQLRYSFSTHFVQNTIKILFSIFSSVSNILGKNRNKGTASSSNYTASNSQWNASPSSIPRRRSGPSTLHSGSEGDFHDGFPSSNRKSPGKNVLFLKGIH